MKKVICFRFDVDTYLCAGRDVPNLVELANKLDVKFTFFFNMGRGIDYKSYFSKKRMQSHAPSGKKLSNFDKLGLFGYLKTAILNPYVGKSYKHLVKAAQVAGHEIGLHGGKNHGAWMAQGKLWSEEKIKNEIEWGLHALGEANVEEITSFSSPGWQGSTSLQNILASKGFTVVADEYGRGLEKVTKLRSCEHTLYSVPTNLVGEPSGIGYIENMRARQMDDAAILYQFRSDLNNINTLAIMYDHPYFAGIRELRMIETMIGIARDLNFSFATFNEVVKFVDIK